MTSTPPPPKYTTEQDAAEEAPISHSSPQTPSQSQPRKSFLTSLTSALKKPFQGWSMDLMAAKKDLDDQYNFSDGRRRYHAEYEQEEARKQ